MDDERRAAAAAVLRGQPVAFAYLFGSRARGDASPGSDADLAVYYREEVGAGERFDRTLRLAALLGQALGLEVDVVALNDAPPLLTQRILQDRVVLFSADEPLRITWESRAFRLAWDFAPRAEAMARAHLAAVARGEA